MMPRKLRLGTTLLLALAVLVLWTGRPTPAEAQLRIPGLDGPATVVRNEAGVPSIVALNEHDTLFMLGWVHSEDRFFQMDVLRRTFSGTLAEITGQEALGQDIVFRTLGLRRAAEQSLAALPPAALAWLEDYTAGVNAWLEAENTSLPPEYTALGLTQASVPPWEAVDSLTVAKGIAFGLSFDLSDLEFTEAVLNYASVGQVQGFDGLALFFADLNPSAPFDPTISIPNFRNENGDPPPTTPQQPLPTYLWDARDLIVDFVNRPAVENLKRLLHRNGLGDDLVVVSGNHTPSGQPLLANSNYGMLDAPADFYEVHLNGGASGLNAGGVSFAGVPGIVQGCNDSICWGATTNPMDVTDVYAEVLVVDPNTGQPTATLFDGQPEPLTAIPQTYRVNQLDPNAVDQVIDSGIGPQNPGGLTLVVPRRNNGPIVAVDQNGDPTTATALSVQYTGWSASQELEAFRRFAFAGNVDQFKDALQYFDAGSQNWGYADTQGNIAYFTSAELPIREDLQTLGRPDGGVPPFLVRDGTHTLQHEWLPVQNPQPQQSLPFEILPFDEMPQVENPASGYVLNANNDPIGTTVDNDPLNQIRSGGGILYLSPGYATGFRMGRLQRLFNAALAGDGAFGPEHARQTQANNQLLDAEVLTPFLVSAFQNAFAPQAPVPLQILGFDPEIQEAVNRLAAWDFSTPTGIPEGFDPGDDPQNLPAPDQQEIDSSVAATIYAAWRSQLVSRVIDGTLAGEGVQILPSDGACLTGLRGLLDDFVNQRGQGASGLRFLDWPGIANPFFAREAILLQSLRDALDLLASDALAPAFGNSTQQDDYRWGYLHRTAFGHPLGTAWSAPPQGGLEDLMEGLPGVARPGGFGSLDVSSHSARADELDDFTFRSGTVRRFIATVGPNQIHAEQNIAGSQDGSSGAARQGEDLRYWLTNQYHPLAVSRQQALDGAVTTEQFAPPGGDPPPGEVVRTVIRTGGGRLGRRVR